MGGFALDMCGSVPERQREPGIWTLMPEVGTHRGRRPGPEEPWYWEGWAQGLALEKLRALGV